MVEAQHRVSTLKVVDSLAEQALLEAMLEETKPPVPPECRHLHYLLATPFRYDGAYPKGSRFRRAGRTPGVYYASEKPRTAVAEMAFYRLLFFAESPATPWPANPAEFTAFSARYLTARGIDLMAMPLSVDRPLWTHPTDYDRCQPLADAARSAGIEIIRYKSARDLQAGANVALLLCKVFRRDTPQARQTWRLRMSSQGIQAICEFPDIRIEFSRDAFASDPRVANIDWER